MLCMSLNVPWPDIVQSMMSLFSSMSSLSNHVSHLGCLYEIEENAAVRKQARFLYSATHFVMTMPVMFAAFMWLYWLVLVPLPLCSCLACGKSDKLYMSDARPVCFKKKPAGEGKARIDRRRNSGGLSAARELDIDLNALIKTRDVWVLCMTLFFYILYPTLVRFPMAMLSCVKLHLVTKRSKSTAPKNGQKRLSPLGLRGGLLARRAFGEFLGHCHARITRVRSRHSPHLSSCCIGTGNIWRRKSTLFVWGFCVSWGGGGVVWFVFSFWRFFFLIFDPENHFRSGLLLSPLYLSSSSLLLSFRPRVPSGEMVVGRHFDFTKVGHHFAQCVCPQRQPPNPLYHGLVDHLIYPALDLPPFRHLDQLGEPERCQR